ncbi:hypothetical protein GCM10022285_54320 [Streptomyces tunisiensis]|uniref:Transposase n=1 Tax=Streptomyces tunisiensis TaxID=948699 RepID=A0ABP7Z595_9ACTN
MQTRFAGRSHRRTGDDFGRSVLRVDQAGLAGPGATPRRVDVGCQGSALLPCPWGWLSGAQWKRIRVFRRDGDDPGRPAHCRWSAHSRSADPEKAARQEEALRDLIDHALSRDN